LINEKVATSVTEINFFCMKKNIVFHEYKHIKNLYVHECDDINNDDCKYFDKIIAFNNYQSNDNVEFMKYSLLNTPCHKYPDIVKSKHEYNVIFLHVMDYNIELFDRIVFALSNLKKIDKLDIRLVVYMPTTEHVSYSFKKRQIIKTKDNTMMEVVYNKTKSVEFPAIDNLDDYSDDCLFNVNMSVNNVNSGNVYYNEFKILLENYLVNYEIIDQRINENELCECIYSSDIYIPMTNEFSDLSLLAQKYKTYCLFLNEHGNAKEYCIYGDIPTQLSKDYFFDINTNRIEKVLRTVDVQTSIKKYYENRDNPFFAYKKEITGLLFGENSSDMNKLRSSRMDTKEFITVGSSPTPSTFGNPARPKSGLKTSDMYMEQVFTKVYESKLWGNNNNSEYNGSSGGGSEIDYNKDSYVPFLKKIIVDNNIKNIVDLGCGDFKCGKLIYDDLDILYTGYDAYKKITEYNSTQYTLPKYSFIHLDFCNNKESIINGELCILKDVIQHWSLKDIYTFLDYLIEYKKFKYILICNCCNQTQDNTDIQNGHFRHLSCEYLPLKKYNPKKIFNYHSKEVSVIEII